MTTPMKTGIYRLLDYTSSADFNKTDPEFDAIYARVERSNKERGIKDRVCVAVADTGIYQELLGDNQFFKRRLIFAKDFTGDDPVETNGVPDTVGTHGSQVASIAGNGSPRIKLIDVMMQSNQTMGEFAPETYASAVQWAIDNGARIINNSITVDWTKAPIQAVVKKNADVLFISTAGNLDEEFDASYTDARGDAYALGNNILVGGCTGAGTFKVGRGYGAAVDVLAPAWEVPCIRPYTIRLAAFENGPAMKSYRLEYAQWQQTVQHFQPSVEKLGVVAKMRLRRLLESKPESEHPTLTAQFLREKVKPPRAPRKPGGTPDETDYAGDDGVSFGLPMVANVAAKMLLINPWLKPPQIIDILKRTADRSAVLEGRSKSGMMNPVRAYKHAELERDNCLPNIIQALFDSPLIARARQLAEELEEVEDESDWED